MARGAVTARVSVNLSDMPAVLHGLRCEMAALLRVAAEAEEPFVAARLNILAAAFEAGVSPAGVRRG